MLAKARAETNRHTEVRERMIAEAHACTFILRVREFKEEIAHIFILKVGVCL